VIPGGCNCGAEGCSFIPHAASCPANPPRGTRATRVVIRGEAPTAVVTVGPPDLEPAWMPAEQELWKFEQES
jgi:hypothetical protein